MNVPVELQPLNDSLAKPSLSREVVAGRPGQGGRAAAVLALIATQTAPDITFIERAATMRKHAGQVAFPGGAIDPTDADAQAAALREANEEIGLRSESVSLLGTLPPAHVAASGFDVTTVVGWWHDPHPVSALEPAEVAAVRRVAVADLVDASNRWTARHPSGYRGPAFTIDDLFIWGLTAHLLDGVLKLAGWSQPWDRHRETEIPERFLTGSSKSHRGTARNAH